MKSRVHPNHKTRYRVQNWPEYERGLLRRGDISVWLSPAAIAAWSPANSGLPGGQRKFSNLAIETTLTLRLVIGLPLRQAEGFLRSLFGLLGLDLPVPDHTTLSRRSKGLGVRLRRSGRTGPIHLIVDSTGLSLVGDGEWAAARHGGKDRRGWKKLHLGVNGAGVIVAQSLTVGSADDAGEGIKLLQSIGRKVGSFTADGAYKSSAIYKAAKARRAKVVVPPSRKTAAPARRKSQLPERDRGIRRIRKVGRRRWKKESGYHRQGRVENTCFRFKSTVGGRLRARHTEVQATEAVIACNDTEQDVRPGAAAISRYSKLRVGGRGGLTIDCESRNNASSSLSSRSHAALPGNLHGTIRTILSEEESWYRGGRASRSLVRSETRPIRQD